MWYGLVIDGELAMVKWFRDPPLIWDFHYGYMTSRSDYDVVEVDVCVKNYLPSCC